MPLSGSQTWEHTEHRHRTSVDGRCVQRCSGCLMEDPEGTGLGGGPASTSSESMRDWEQALVLLCQVCTCKAKTMTKITSATG